MGTEARAESRHSVLKKLLAKWRWESPRVNFEKLKMKSEETDAKFQAISKINSSDWFKKATCKKADWTEIIGNIMHFSEYQRQQYGRSGMNEGAMTSG